MSHRWSLINRRRRRRLRGSRSVVGIMRKMLPLLVKVFSDPSQHFGWMPKPSRGLGPGTKKPG